MTILPKLKYSLAAALTVATTLAITASASAHVTVKPAEVGTAAFQTFTTGVPNEKDIPTTGLRLVLSDNLNYVTPNVKPGWSIETKKSGTGDDAKVTEINWTGGSIPAGQRDEFLFSAQVPDTATTLQWKAYQTYQDGTVVAWDQKPSDNHDDESVKPYSETKVVDDLATAGDHGSAATASTGMTSATQKSDEVKSTIALMIAIIAAGFAIPTFAKVISTERKNNAQK